MGKWLAIAGAGLLVLLLLMWHELDASSASTVSQPTPVAKATPTAVASAPSVAPVKPVTAEPETAPVDEASKKLDPMGDEFFYKFTELVPAMVSRQAAICYNGKLGTKHRNQKLTLKYNVQVRNGEVTIRDVKVDTSTLNDPALESCFIQQVARTTWKNPTLPDYDWPDELVIRPERGLKKYLKENVDYVGEPAPPHRNFTIDPVTGAKSVGPAAE